MPILTPNATLGATTKPMPMVTVRPEAAMTEQMAAEAADRAALDGMNVPYLLDEMSAMLAHERCGRHLYKSVAGRTGNPMLKARYEQFGEETERHVQLLEALVTALGGDPLYVSPAARAVEGMDSHLLQSTYLLTGSVDLVVQERVMLDAVFVAETICHSNWQMLIAICEAMPEGPVRDEMQVVVDEVDDQEDEHLDWARSTREQLTLLQAKSSFVAGAQLKMEEMVARVKEWFSTGPTGNG